MQYSINVSLKQRIGADIIEMNFNFKYVNIYHELKESFEAISFFLN